jgi:topoisomerase-4 subunit A
MGNETLDLFESGKVGPAGTANPPPAAPPSGPDALPDDALPLDLYAERAYLAYAMSVVNRPRPAAGRGRP